MLEAVSGTKCSASFASYDRASSSWRTSQTSLFAGSTSSSLALPKAGLMQSGCLFERPTLERLTVDCGSSLWPTPTETDSSLSRREGYTFEGNTGRTLTDAVLTHLGLSTVRQRGERTPAPAGPNPAFVEALMGFPPGWTAID